MFILQRKTWPPQSVFQAISALNLLGFLFSGRNRGTHAANLRHATLLANQSEECLPAAERVAKTETVELAAMMHFPTSNVLEVSGETKQRLPLAKSGASQLKDSWMPGNMTAFFVIYGSFVLATMKVFQNKAPITPPAIPHLLSHFLR